MQPKPPIDQLVQEQLAKWKMAAEEERPKTVITISREPGCNGAAIAANLADVFKLDLYAGKIVEEVAKSAKMSDKVIETLDERGRSMLDDWIAMLDSSHNISSYKYMNHIMKLMGTVARHGQAVILGRGGTFLIEPEKQLRIRLIAPLETRIRNVMQRFGSSREEAQKRISQVEKDRKAYNRKYFKADITDPIHYDLVINTGYITHDAIIDMTRAGLKAKKMV